jgi:hypothetical protein
VEPARPREQEALMGGPHSNLGKRVSEWRVMFCGSAPVGKRRDSDFSVSLFPIAQESIKIGKIDRSLRKI